MSWLTKCIGLASILLLASCSSDSEDLTGQCSAIGLSEKSSTDFVAKISNGRECTDAQKSPVVAIIQRTPNGSSGLCTGTLITPTQVLTAAHCLVDAATVDVIYGVAPERYARMSGSSWVIHPQFAQTASGRLLYDIGVINLLNPLPISPLPILSSTTPQNGQRATIAGFGLTAGNASDGGVLRVGAQALASVEPEIIIAVSEEGSSNTCFGDSGGPLLVQQNGQAQLIGTTSYGSSNSCALGELTVYMNLQSATLQNFLRRYAPGAKYN